VICRSRPIVAALDAWLAGLDPERFVALVPVLRRALSTLGPTERRYLVENILALHRSADPGEARALLDTREEAALAGLDGLLDDLEDLL
jgi:hypothetical protein